MRYEEYDLLHLINRYIGLAFFTGSVIVAVNHPLERDAEDEFLDVKEFKDVLESMTGVRTKFGLVEKNIVIAEMVSTEAAQCLCHQFNNARFSIYVYENGKLIDENY